MADITDDTKNFTILLTAPVAAAKGIIVDLTYPASVEHGKPFDVDASTKNVGGSSGTFRMDWYIDGSLAGLGAPFTLAAGATSEDKIDPWLAAPGSGTSMAISVKCIRIT